MGFYATDSMCDRSQETYLPPKNRVGGFSASTPDRARRSTPQTLEPHRENEPTPTSTASGVRFYGYRFYNPELGRWINRDPIEEEGGIHLYAFVVNNPLRFIDILGQEFEVIEESVPLQSIVDIHGIGILGWTGTGVSPTFSGQDVVVEFQLVTSWCAYVERAQDIHIRSRSLVPSTGTLMIDGNEVTFITALGLQHVRDHERRRVEAMRLAYDAYLRPSQGTGGYALRCGMVCRCTQGEAKGLLEQYLSSLRSRAVTYYQAYNTAQQVKVGMEQPNYITPPNNFGVPAFDHYSNIAVFDPVNQGMFRMEPPACPANE